MKGVGRNASATAKSTTGTPRQSIASVTTDRLKTGIRKMADIRVCSHGKTSPCDECQLAGMLALRKRLDPDAPDAIVFREQYMGDFEQSHAADGDLIDRVLQIMGNPGITERTYAKLKVVLAGKAYTAPLDDSVTLLERNNGRLREVLKEALEQTGCDGDLCNYRWHEKARALLGE